MIEKSQILSFFFLKDVERLNDTFYIDCLLK